MIVSDRDTPRRPLTPQWGRSMLRSYQTSPIPDGVVVIMEATPVGRPVSSPRVLMVAGGTGGHIFPALVVAEELRARAMKRGQIDSAIHFLGTSRGLESRVVPRAGFALQVIPAAGLKGLGGFARVRNFFMLPGSFLRARAILRDLHPNVVVGTGGYLAGPPLLEAASMGIPTVLIEPNLVPGLTNRLLAPVVRGAAVGFPQTAQYFGPKARVTGHPVRKAFAEITPKEHAPPFTVLILGGSQGSKAINECVVKALPFLPRAAGRLNIVHQTGERDYNVVKEAYAKAGFVAEIFAFIEDVAGAFARADLVVARAGAVTVSELAAAGKAALLVPFPSAADNHQLENARALEGAGAARVIAQDQLDQERLTGEIMGLLDRPERLKEMGRLARTFARPDAAERIADLIEELAAKG